jgi:hypothetical protein
MWTMVKTILLVTILSALVWVFAESETLRQEKFTIELVVQPPQGSDLAIDLAGRRGSGARVEVVLEAAAIKLEEAERILKSAVALVPGDALVPRAPGEHTLDLLTILRAEPEFDALGVNLIRVEPAKLDIVIDEMMTRELPVQVQAPGVELQASPIVRPPTAKVRLSKRDEAKLPAGNTVQATLAPEAIARLVPGQPQTIQAVRLLLPAGLDAARATIEPAMADVQLTIRTRTSEVIIARVPVQLRLPPSELSRWEIAIADEDRILSDVRVSGPAELVQQVENRLIPIVATLTLTYEDLERGVTSKDVTFSDVPSALNFGVANKTIRVRITKR